MADITAADAKKGLTISDVLNQIGQNRIGVNFTWTLICGFLIMFLQAGFAMSLLFTLALAAVYIGVAAIVGAFLAGLALAESTGQRERDLAHSGTEVGKVVAQIGLGFGIIPQNVYSVVVFMSVATTIVAPR